MSEDTEMRSPKVGLVLAGGAARGAYEVGVLQYLAEEVARDLAFDLPLDVLCGTSVGAVNVCCMAAWADEPRGRVERLKAVWTGLRISDVLRPTATGLVDLARGLLGRGPPIESSALFDAAPLETLMRGAIPFDRIEGQLRAGRLSAVTVSATQIGTGRTVVFVQRAQAQPAPWPRTPNVIPRAVQLRPIHALASAAVPLLFPAVRIDGRYYCDGGLRQNIPLSPARRLGATDLVVVNPKHRRRPDEVKEDDGPQTEEVFPSPLFLLGKSLNAILLDRIDNEIDRLEKINEILDAGRRRYGSSFLSELNDELGAVESKGLQRLTTVHIRASENIGRLSAEYVRHPSFHVPGMLGRVMKRLAAGEATREADLLSYVLFDGKFAAMLTDLGRSDARQYHDELCTLFESVRKRRAAEK